MFSSSGASIALTFNCYPSYCLCSVFFVLWTLFEPRVNIGCTGKIDLSPMMDFGSIVYDRTKEYIHQNFLMVVVHEVINDE